VSTERLNVNSCEFLHVHVHMHVYVFSVTTTFPSGFDLSFLFSLVNSKFSNS
jgi:hypothetical protein